MKVKFTYSKRDPSGSVEALVTKKLSKLKKYFRGEVLAEVNIKASGKSHAMSMLVDSAGSTYNVSSVNSDMYKNIDVCINKLKTQVKKAKMDYRTDSRKVSEKVAFNDKYNLEPVEEAEVD